MELSSLLIFAGALFVAAGSPGPSVAALVARVLARGYRDVLPFLLAMWIGEAIWLSMAVFGLAAIANTFYWLFLAIKWAGVAYLFYLAWKMWTAPAVIADDNAPQTREPFKLFLTGMAVTMGNPKIMMFYMALLPTIIDIRHVTLIGWAELVAVTVVVLMIIDLGWTALAARARTFLKSPRAVRIANRTSAGAMAGAAVAIATR